MHAEDQPTKKRRAPRRVSFGAMIRAIGREPIAIEQKADGTTRLIFADTPTDAPNPWDVGSDDAA